MPHFVENLVGRSFGRLTVVSRAANSKRGNARWNCHCSCGGESTVVAANLRSGAVSACGCVSVESRTIHGHSRRSKHSTEYIIWSGMIKRCENENCQKFPIYGGRGIKVCARWREDFSAFLADMGPRPSAKHSIDRYPDNDGNYEPGNCRWATRRQQDTNMRRNLLVDFRGKRMTLVEAVELVGARYSLVHGRLRRGWSIDRALYSPARRMDCRMPVGYL